MSNNTVKIISTHHYSKSKHHTTTGDMICCKCAKPVNSTATDWKSEKVTTPDNDWKYRSTHRACCDNQSIWVSREAKAAKSKATQLSIVEFLTPHMDGYTLSDELHDALVDLRIYPL